MLMRNYTALYYKDLLVSENLKEQPNLWLFTVDNGDSFQYGKQTAPHQTLSHVNML